MIRRAPLLLFAAVAVLVGVVVALMVPPMAGFDEEDHYLRAYQVAHGTVLGHKRGDSSGGTVPVQLATLTATDAVLADVRARPTLYRFDGFGGGVSRSREVFVDFRNTAGYSPLPYLPAAVVMRIGEASGASARGLLYLERLGQLIAFVALLAGAAALYRPAAPVLLAVGLLPAAIVQAATVSADAVTTGVAALVLASVLRGLRAPRPLPESVGLAVALALVKPIYVLLVLGYLLPAGVRWWRRVLPVAVGAVVALGWAVLAQTVYLPLQPLFGAQGTVDPGRQRSFVLHHPLSFLAAVGRTVGDQAGDVLRAVVGHLTRADYPIPLAVVVLLWLLLVATAVASPGEEPTRAARIVLPAVAVVGTAVLVLFLYLSSTQVGGRTVYGVQGRYLVPFLPAVLVALPRVRRLADLPAARVELAAVGASAVLLVTAVAYALS